MVTTSEARAELWRRGELSWKLRGHQQELYRLARETPAKLFYVEIARRFGKSFTLVLVAVEYALKNPRALIRFAAPFQKDLEEIYAPMMEDILADCPPEMKPVWKGQKFHWYFPSTGARLYMTGTDNENYKKLRGKATHLGVVDEAGSCSRLKHIVDSIMMPQTMGVGGRIILATTPAETPDHDSTNIAIRCEARGHYIKRTIDDNKYLSDEERAAYIEEAGGRDSVDCRREYYCERIVDPIRAVVPEFTPERESRIVAPITVPKHYHPIEAMDVGKSDFTAVLFGYFDWFPGHLVIQDELLLRRKDRVWTTKDLAADIKAKEQELWGKREVFIRASDNDLVLLDDLSIDYGVHFVPTEKHDKDTQIKKLRTWVQSEKIRIDPRCKHLIAQLKGAIWNLRRTEFERSEDQGHYDAVDALIYMLRNAPIYVNPYPSMPEGVTRATHLIVSNDEPENDTERALLSLFRRKANG